MKMFLSWSGERSMAVADALRSWIPFVLNAVKPWMSAADIEKGSRWGADLSTQLQDARIGIICITPENTESPWILFEAGALSKTLDATFVCTYLFQVEATDLTGPLVQFQATRAEKEDTRKLLHTVNSALASMSVPDRQLNEVFEVLWPRLEEQLKAIPTARIARSRKRPDRELLEELLELVRAQARSTESERTNLAFDREGRQVESGDSSHDSIEKTSRIAAVRALRRSAGKLPEAASALGISRQALIRIIQTNRITADDWQSEETVGS